MTAVMVFMVVGNSCDNSRVLMVMVVVMVVVMVMVMM
jgi:hypothetical protein